MIKVAKIITRLEMGGSTETVLLQCRKADPEKFEIHLIYGLSTSNEFDPFGIKSYHVTSLVRNLSPLNDLKALFAVYRLLKEIKPDVVHTHTSKAGIIGRWAAWLYNRSLPGKPVKIVHRPHGHIFYGYEFGFLRMFIFRLAERITAGITDRLIALTEGEKRESVGFGVGRPEQWVVIHSDVDLRGVKVKPREELRKYFAVKDNALVIGTVARLEHVKGVRYFVKAVPLILERMDPETRAAAAFMIVGDGSEKKMLEGLAERLRVRDKLIFTGLRTDVMDVMNAMDIYVQPSLNEGMGKTLVQAHFLKLPIAATRVQGIPDVVLDGKSGILVPPADPEALAGAVSRLASDAALRKSMGEAGHAYVTRKIDGLQCFSAERMLALLDKMYEELIKD